MGTFRREHGNIIFQANLSSLKFEKDIYLTLEETKELLGLIGSTLSEHLFVDRVISYCLNQNEYDYDVEDINEIIYDITGRSPFIKY